MRLISKIEDRQFVATFTFMGLDNIQLGLSICLTQPNIEIHLPFCFIRIGWMGVYTYDIAIKHYGKKWKPRREL